jgi:adenine-specific DNA-methyltransferase
MLAGSSWDITKSNIEKLRSLFPESIVDGKIDFDRLRLILSDDLADDNEKYSLSWNGKGKALRLALTPATSVLRPDLEMSVDWENTKNIYIEGDNLEALKVLQRSYSGKIDLIYIDPPYNTGSDFVYQDDFTESIKNYKKLTGKQGPVSDHEMCGRYHTNWLNMILPRLKVARDFLSEQGVILISIDDNEVDNLRKVCNEVYGEENLVNCFIWNCSTGGGIRPKFASKTHEYVLCYAKNINLLNKFEAPLSEDTIKLYCKKDEKGAYREKDFIFKNASTNKNQKYYIECPDGQKVKPGEGYIYRFIRETFDKALEKDMVVFKKSKYGPLVDESGNRAGWNIYIKKYLGMATGAPSTLIPKEMVSIYNAGTKCVQDLFDGNRVFENSKPVDLITYFGKFLTRKDSIILDFFSGSATTAHAVMQLNYEDHGSRSYILIQLPEGCEEKSAAYRMGYKNICQIGAERIRRASKEYTKSGIDTGFRYFRLEPSNFVIWDADHNT